MSLDDDKPLSSIKRRASQKAGERSGISVDQPKKPEYDWFDFFLQCGVNPQICERYASSFARDEMREDDMESINPQLCRTLGLKEGDILRVMKFLDTKFGRERTGEADANGSLFTGAGGALKNNTGRTRPSPTAGPGDKVDANAFKQDTGEKGAPTDGTPTPLASAPKPERRLSTGFEDNAWEPRQVKQPSAASPSSTAPTPAPAPVQRPAPTGAAADLTSLSAPLEPTPAPAPAAPAQTTSPASAPQQPAQPAQPAQPQGATPSLFEQLAKANPQQPTNMNPQATGFNQQQQFGPPRQRPQPPQQMNSAGGLAPPPQRAASVPNQSGFQPPPLQPQLTGYNPQFQGQMAPPGQSLQDLRQQTLQQQFLQNQQTGFPGQFHNGIMPQPTGYGQFPQGMQPQPTGFQPQFQPSVQQQFLNGQMAGSPFADPTPRQSFHPMQAQPTGYNQFGLQPQPTGVNAFLPPALTPQRTGALSNNTLFGQPPQQLQQQAPPIPPIPQQPTIAPLQPQKTGPPPPVRFGVNPAANKLTPQPTGRRANLSQASKSPASDACPVY